MTNADGRDGPDGPRAASFDADACVAGASRAATRRPATLAVYYALVVTQAVSQIGSQISGYAVGIAVFRATGRATPLALVAFCSVVPQVLFSGLAGALADRFDRRALMLVANVGYVAASGLLLASFASGAFQLWHLYALTFAASVFARLEQPAFGASVTVLVPDSHRDRANAVGQMTAPVAGAVAPAAAGMLYAVVGVAGSILIDIATFIVAIAVLAMVRIPRPATTAEGAAMGAPLWRQLFDGFRYLAARPALFGFCGYLSAINFVANAAVLLTPYVLARTGGAQQFGGVMAVMNVGMLAGSLVISAGGHVGSRLTTVMVGIVASSLFLALAGVAQGALALGAVLFLHYFALAFSNAPFWSMLQAKVAPDLQGRVFAAYVQGILLMTPLALLVAGPLADRVFEPARRLPAWRSVGWLVGAGPGAGIGLMFVVAGVLMVALSVAVYAIPAVRRLETDLPDHTATAA